MSYVYYLSFYLVEPKSPAPKINAVIDTKPTAPPQQPTLVIKPSKTIQKPPENRPSPSESVKKLSSVVQVHTNAAPPVVVASKVEVISQAKSKVNVVEGISSVVHVAKAPPRMSSKVEVVAGHATAPSPKIFTKVEVISSPPTLQIPQILSSKVEVFEAKPSPTKPAFVVSSVVEVKSGDEEPVLIGKYYRSRFKTF